MIIKQSYRGTGDAKRHQFEVYKSKNSKKLGEIKDMPPSCGVGDIVRINYDFYIVTNDYDSDDPNDEENDVIYYELEPYVIEPDYDLGKITLNIYAQ